MKASDALHQQAHSLSRRRHTPSVILTTLGAASLSARDGPGTPAVALGPGKPLALITYLSCACGRGATRAHLVELLWTDSPPEAGDHNLRQTVWYLRQRLGHAAVTVQHSCLTLNAPVTCDRDTFLAAVEGGDLERAVSLYRGDFLPGGAGARARGFEEWADRERYRLRRLFQRAAESVVRSQVLAAGLDDAQQLARRLRDADPEDEGGWRVLMETFLASGDRTLAATEADVLEWQLALRGRDPEPATRAVLRHVRRRATEYVSVPAHAGMRTPRLVGREDQLATFMRVWQDVTRGHGSHVAVISAAGFGKTRLLKEAQNRLDAIGAQAVYLAAKAATREIPHVFASEIATALTGLPGSAGVSMATAASLVALNPALSSHFPVEADPTVGDEAIRRRLLALLELVQALSEEQPFALLLDDLQWADSGSRRIVEGLLSRVEDLRAMVVTAARPVPSPYAVTPNSTTLHLPPLDVAQVGGLVADLGALPDLEWARRLPEQLRSVAAGSPLVLLDVLEEAVDEGVLTLGREGWRCSDPQTLTADLEALGASRIRPIESHPRSLLVVPFTAGDHAELEHLGDGLTEDLIALLSRVDSLRVISWMSTRRLKGTDRDAVALASELNARYVVRGGVRADGSRLHVSAALIEGVNGSAVWETTWRGTQDRVSGVAQEFARAIAEALSVRVSQVVERRIRHRAIPHAGAYDRYLRAREAMSRDTPEGYVRAASLLRSALTLAGENALLYATLGTVYSRQGMQLLENARSVLRAAVCARKALTLDPESADAHFLSGLVRCRRGDLKHGVRDMLRALAINPTHTDALYWCSGWLATIGRPESARPLAQRLLETDPLTPTNVCMPGWVEWLAGRFEAAAVWYRRWIELEPKSPVALHVAVNAFIWGGRFDEARDALERLTATAPSSPLAQFNPVILHALAGRKAATLAAVTPQLASAAASYEITCWQMAAYFAMVDAFDEALAWLERAVQRGFINYPMLAEYDPFLKKLRGDARYSHLMDRVKREWEGLEL